MDRLDLDDEDLAALDELELHAFEENLRRSAVMAESQQFMGRSGGQSLGGSAESVEGARPIEGGS